MSIGLIDSASIYQVIQCLDRAYADHYPWSLQTAIELTSLLISTEHQHCLAPGLFTTGGVYIDDYDYFLGELFGSELIKPFKKPNVSIAQMAKNETIKWAGLQLEGVSKEASKLFEDKKNFDPWLDWAANKAWHSHSERLGGLFDKIFIPPIARILNIGEADTHDLHNQSCDHNSINTLVTRRNNDFLLMSKAYIISTILRGKYHDEIANLTNVIQIFHHPIRKLINKEPHRDTIPFEVSPLTNGLAIILIYGAAQQKDIRSRLACWIYNIGQVRSFLAQNPIDINKLLTGSKALDYAARIAKEAKVVLGDRRFDSMAETLLTLGIGFLTSFKLNIFLSTPISTAASCGAKKTGLISKSRNMFLLRGRKLKELAAGRIIRGWKKAK